MNSLSLILYIYAWYIDIYADNIHIHLNNSKRVIMETLRLKIFQYISMKISFVFIKYFFSSDLGR